jgi:3-phosphoshikimate 1-carboxyvinyltransferase
VLFAALAQGESRIENFLVSGVTKVMLESLSALGVAWKLEHQTLWVQGRGLDGLRAPEYPLNCGNSATTIRLLVGALAAAGIPAVLDGSEGLRRRPMNRIVEPLQRMGVPIEASTGGMAPLTLHARRHGQKLIPLDETLPVASAQVKSCLLLAGLAASGTTTLREPGPSRDHTERMLRSMGVDVSNTIAGQDDSISYEVRVRGEPGRLMPLEMTLPGDFSAAAFLITAGVITPRSEIRIRGVETNPTRTGLLDAFQTMGAEILLENASEQGGEPTADLLVRTAKLHGTTVRGSLVVRMIDEFSVFGAAAAAAEGMTVVRDASELRLKESDRISSLCQELNALGIEADEAEDGFIIHGGRIRGGRVQSHGDHRLAMAMTVAGQAAESPVLIDGAEIISESFPEFINTLQHLGANLKIEGA